MKKTMFALAALGMLAMLGTPAFTQAQADTRPGVAVLHFNINVLGASRDDYAPLDKGIAAMLTSELARNTSIRVVDRDRIETLLKEQDLGAAGRMDANSAARVGKLIGAKYMLWGDVSSDLDTKTRQPKEISISIKVVNSETSEITTLGTRLTGKPDDLASMIVQATGAASTQLKLPALPPGPARDAANAAAEQTKKMPLQTAMLYARALQAKDSGKTAEARTLFKQVVDKFPYPPAQQELTKLGTK